MKQIKQILHAKKSQTILFLLILSTIGTLLRLYNLNWDRGHYLHPDERLYINASNLSLPHTISELLSPASPLNPNMFYYGSFPLYLYKGISVIIPNLDLLLTSRCISAFFSILTIPLLYLLTRQLFTRKISMIAAFIFTFSAGSIQYSHFNTTESILVFFISLITLLSIFFAKHASYKILIFTAIAVGLAYATKITGVIFAIEPALAFVFSWFYQKKYRKSIIAVLLFVGIAIMIGVIAAPYQLIDSSHFLKEQEFMQGVTYGKYKPPFIIIYEQTIPYIYPLRQILPFTFGFLALPLALIGMIRIIQAFISDKIKCRMYVFILLLPILYFLWAGLWYAKFSRYYMLLFPFLSIWAAYVFERFSKRITIILLICIAINGIAYMKVYIAPHTRIQASEWMYKNISHATIAQEHWDDGLPLSLPQFAGHQSLQTIQLTVYDPDTSEKVKKLSQDVAKSDYIVLSSRRVYYSILQNPKTYPDTNRFYHLLFNGSLGFVLKKTFTNYPFGFSDDFADESFQSYDHPPVLIFYNQEKKSAQEIQQLISHDN